MYKKQKKEALESYLKRIQKLQLGNRKILGIIENVELETKETIQELEYLKVLVDVISSL